MNPKQKTAYDQAIPGSSVQQEMRQMRIAIESLQQGAGAVTPSYVFFDDGYREGVAKGYCEGVAKAQADAREKSYHSFNYTAHAETIPREGYFIGVDGSTGSTMFGGFTIWVNETWNRRDGWHDDPRLKRFLSGGIWAVTTAKRRF